jgi:hypothetical protein
VKSEFLKLLRQKASGFEADEVVEEYVNDEDGLKLVKRKVTKKYIPPDTSAVKILMDLEPNIEDLTDREISLGGLVLRLAGLSVKGEQGARGQVSIRHKSFERKPGRSQGNQRRRRRDQAKT